MHMRWLPRLVVAAALLASPALVTTGCAAKGPARSKIEAPAAGVALGYDFTPGQTYSGSVQRTETLQIVGFNVSLTRSIKFGVNLTVLGPDPAHQGAHLLHAKLSAVDIVWALPPGTPVGVSEVTAAARKLLNGADIDITVDDRGNVLSIPEPPDGVSAELKLIIQQALDALEVSFYTIPDHAVKVGEQWSDDKSRGRKGKLGRFTEGKVTTTVEGLYRLSEGNTEVVQLELKSEETEVTTAKSGSHEVKRRGTATTLFAAKDGYLRHRMSDEQTFDTGNSTTFTQLTVAWTKGEKKAVAAPTKTSVQRIDDPCDPNYVGPNDCVPAGSNVQTIEGSDPCDPNYVGPDDCVPAEAAPAPDAAAK
ncbi:MAG: hypothetical protein KC636_36010 [Myxococcales bacterium]|nr:hypothetical protein [Myxococcales bacterium]